MEHKLVTIIGGGMGPSKLSRVKADLSTFDAVVCDKSYEIDIAHPNIVAASFLEAKKYILEAEKSANIAYIVSGSPFFYSGATSVMGQLKETGADFSVITGESSKEYAVRSLCIAENEVTSLSWHGREDVDIDRFLRSRYTFLLCDEKTPQRLFEAISYLPSGSIKIICLSRLGYDDERIFEVLPTDLPDYSWRELSPFVFLVEKIYADRAAQTADDELEYERGMYTKPDKRSLILRSLELKAGISMWDIGAGSGSVSIDAFKGWRVKTVLFEKNETRCEIIERNLTAHNVLFTKLCCGEALDFLDSQTGIPDRIFVGGGGAEIAKNLHALTDKLGSGGILVAVYVSLEHLGAAINSLSSANISYEVKSISLSGYKEPLKIGEPEREMFLIKVKK